MNLMAILIAAAVIGITGLIIGLLLGIAGEKLNVETDPRVDAVRACLPGNNCGGCGYPGCDGLAQAIVDKIAPITACPVGGGAVADAIGKIMGETAPTKERQVAFVKCSGSCNHVKLQYHYYGEPDCRNVAVVPGHGEKRCEIGCIGFGSCVKVCDFGAITVKENVAYVDREKCVACGKCEATCPHHIIEMVPYRAKHMVQCSTNEKGANVKVACTAGCIGCGLCTRACEAGAITVTNNLAHIDYERCTNCGECAKKCPVKVIVTL